MSKETQLRYKQILDNTAFKKGLKESQSQADNFAAGIKNIGLGIAAAFSVSAIINFGKQAMIAAGQQQKAEAQLTTLLKQRKAVTDDLIAQADKLQWKSLFNDEDIIRAQSILAVYTKDVAKLKELIPLVLDYAAAMGIDLDQAAKQVGKALVQTGETFGKTGLKLDGLANSTERYNSVLDVLAEFSGVAESQIRNQEAAITQLDKAWGELLETMGDEGGWNVVTYNLQFAILKLNDFLKAVEDAGGAWRMFLGISNIKGPGLPTTLDGTPLVKSPRDRKYYPQGTSDLSMSGIGAQSLVGAGILTGQGNYPDPYSAPLPKLFSAIAETAEKASQAVRPLAEHLQDMAENGHLWFGAGGGSSTLEDYMNISGLQVQGNAKTPGMLTARPVELDFFNNKIQETIDWANVAQVAFIDLGEAMAQAFQKGANFGEIFLQMLIKMAAMIAGTAIGGPVGGMVGGLIGGFGSGMFNSAGGGGITGKINYQSPGAQGEWRIRGEDLVYIVNKQNSKKERYG
jgi:hypothetical protein